MSNRPFACVLGQLQKATALFKWYGTVEHLGFDWLLCGLPEGKDSGLAGLGWTRFVVGAFACFSPFKAKAVYLAAYSVAGGFEFGCNYAGRVPVRPHAFEDRDLFIRPLGAVTARQAELKCLADNR